LSLVACAGDLFSRQWRSQFVSELDLGVRTGIIDSSAPVSQAFTGVRSFFFTGISLLLLVVNSINKYKTLNRHK
jgi:hypothetical protein